MSYNLTFLVNWITLWAIIWHLYIVQYHVGPYCNEYHDDLSLGVRIRRYIRSGPPKPAPTTCYSVLLICWSDLVYILKKLSNVLIGMYSSFCGCCSSSSGIVAPSLLWNNRWILEFKVSKQLIPLLDKPWLSITILHNQWWPIAVMYNLW